MNNFRIVLVLAIVALALLMLIPTDADAAQCRKIDVAEVKAADVLSVQAGGLEVHFVVRYVYVPSSKAGRCSYEKVLARLARDFTKDWIADGVTACNPQQTPSPGVILISAKNAEGGDLADALIRAHLGSTDKETTWCDQLL